MAYPPTGVTAGDLFARLIQNKPFKVVDFPRNDAEGNPVCEVALVIVSQQEAMLIAAAAEKTTRRIMKDDIPKQGEESKGYRDVHNNALAIETLFRACRHPEDVSKPFFPSKDAIGDVLVVDEISILLNHYFTFQVETGPIIGAMTDNEMQAWVKKLGEGGASGQYFLNSLSWAALKELLISMATQLTSLQTDKSSAGSLPESTILSE